MTFAMTTCGEGSLGNVGLGEAKRGQEVETERANCFFSWGFHSLESRAMGRIAGETWMEADVSRYHVGKSESRKHIGEP